MFNRTHKLTRQRTVNLPMVLKVTGWLLMVEALFMLIPMTVGIAAAEADWLVFAVTAAVTAACGFGMRCIPVGSSGGHMGRREGFLLTATVWIWFSLFGMLPLMFCRHHLGVSDAFFQAMSGFTTTGASSLGTARLSMCVNLWLVLSQWLGGMGIILFTLAVIPMLNSAGGMQMFNAEVTGITHDKVRPRISSTAKALWGTYMTLTALTFLCLWVGPMDAYQSLCYAMASLSTGGFVGSCEPLPSFGSDYVYAIITVFMFLGGVNFTLIFKNWWSTRSPSGMWHNEVFRAFVCITLVCYALTVTSMAVGGQVHSWQDAVLYPMFHTVSMLTSASFDSGHFGYWSPLIICVTLFMMMSGACAGSTTGGVKIDRVLIVLKHLRNEIYKCVRPNAVLSIRMNGRVLSSGTIGKVGAFMFLYVIIVFGAAMALSMMGMSFGDALFAPFSCMSNVAFDISLTDFGADFSLLPAPAKWLLSAVMLVGRLEIYTIVILFTPPFWRK